MRSDRFLLLLCSLVTLGLAAASAQWAPTNGPYGGQVLCLSAQGAELMAGSYTSGVYVSTDNGAHWTARNSGLDHEIVTALAAHGAHRFAGTSHGVYHSVDSLGIWSEVGLGGHWIQTLLAVPDGAGGADIFAGASGGGLFRSTDNGLNWLPADTGLPVSSVMALTWTSAGLFAGVWQYGVYRSTDAGGHWTPADSGLESDFRIGALASWGDTLYVGTIGGRFFTSTDAGALWVRLNPTERWNAIHAIVPSESHLLVGSYAGVFRSTDHGITWGRSNEGLTDVRVNTMVACPGDVGDENVVLGTTRGVYRSSDGGVHWMEASSGFTGLEAYAMGHIPDGAGGKGLFIGTVTSGLYRTTDVGATWSPFGTGLPENTIRDLVVVDGVTAFAATYEGLFRSTDYAATWTRIDSGLTADQVDVILPSGNDLMMGTEDGGVFRSTDGGISWAESNTGITNRKIYSLAAGSSYLFAGTDSGVFRSSDNGGTWVSASEGLFNLYVSGLAVSVTEGPDTVILAGTWSSIYYSTDNGTSWNLSPSSGFGRVWDFLVRPRHTDAGTVFAATSMGILVSTDHGVTWTGVNEGLTDLVVLSLEVEDEHLLAGLYGGAVWKRPLSEMVVTDVSEGNQLPGSFALEQNYPNPFNPTTTIQYTIAGVVALSGAPSSGDFPEHSRGVEGRVSTKVRLAVYDLLGREVAVLVDERRAAGQYQDTFDGTGLASGLYIYRLTAGGRAASRTMLLIK